MRSTKFITFILVLLVFVSPLFINTTSLAAFRDIDHNWAKDAILDLEKQGLFEDLWTEEFAPSNSLSHVEAYELFATAFKLTEDKRQEAESWLADLLVQHDEGVTRGEFAAILAKLLGLETQNKIPQNFYPSFTDLNLDYPGFMGVELVHRLELLPPHITGRFEPYRLITRSESAFILNQALGLQKITGLVEKIDNDSKQFSLKRIDDNQELVFNLSNKTLYLTPGNLRKEVISNHEELTKGQQIIVLSRQDQAFLVNFEQISTAQAVLEGLNTATKALVEILTPAQINAIIAGDWEQLSEEVSYELYEELVERGVSPWEADALLKRDWDSVQMMLQERLTLEAASYLNVAPELIQAAVSQDWQKLLEYAQVELAGRLLTSDWLKDATTK